MSLYQRLCGHAEFQPNSAAIESESGVVTYLQLKVLTDQCCDWFDSRGLSCGDRVGILAQNHADWFICLFAAARCRLILVPLNWRLSVAELGFVVSDCEPALLLHDSTFAETARQLVTDESALQLIGNRQFPPSTKNTFVPGAATDSDLLIVYTSGTTGQPKGAVLRESAVLCSAEMSQHMYDLTPEDRVLNVLPLFHVGGLNIQPLPALLYGATLVSQSRFDAIKALDSLVNDKITLMNSVPTVLQAIIDTEQWAEADLSSIRAISIGSTDVPVSLIQSVHAKGVSLIQVYGATEMAPVAIYQRIEHADIEGTIGRAGLLNEIRLVNEQGIEVAVGESGEIQVKGRNLLDRYWKNPQATDAALNDGWFRSGDVAHKDTDGFYWFDDRLKHVIISGGENIYPAELERLIRDLDGVTQVAVVGRTHEKWGEVPVAVVVSEPQITAENIKAACETIARFKQLHDVIFVKALPANALGKVVVAKVKELVQQKMTNGRYLESA